jgi:hypothetical protein
MKNLPFAALAIGAVLGACQPADPVPGLPPATATGARTLGFVLDGRAGWVPAGQRCGLYGCTDNQVQASSYVEGGRRRLLLTAVRTDGRRNDAFVLQLDSLAGPGTYRATAGGPGATGAEAGAKLYFATRRPGQQYQSRPGSATITIRRIDTVQQIVAGTFEGELTGLEPATGRVRLHQGRFDVRYNH